MGLIFKLITPRFDEYNVKDCDKTHGGHDLSDSPTVSKLSSLFACPLLQILLYNLVIDLEYMKRHELLHDAISLWQYYKC